MKRFGPRTWIVLICGCLLGATMAGAQDGARPPAGIDPQCEAMVRRMGERLASAQSFTFNAYTIRQEFLDDGQKVDVARKEQVAVRRPDRVSASITGDEGDSEFTFDGKTVTLLNQRDHVYGQTEIAGNLDHVFDTLATKYGMTLPLVDLVLADPAKAMLARVHSCTDLGLAYVFDTKCRHLAFRQGDIDWEVWIQEGDEPLPRKLAITYKDSPGNPQYIAYLSDWKLNADLPDERFTFTPPADAKKVDFAVPARATAPPPGKETK